MQHTIQSLLFSAALMGLMPIITLGQVSIHGTVRSDDGEAVPFAHVVLRLVQDSVLVTGTMTGPDGAFRLSSDAGEFLLGLSMTGYRSEHFLIQVDAAQKELLLGDLYLKEDITELKAVEVTALKPRVENYPTGPL